MTDIYQTSLMRNILNDNIFKNIIHKNIIKFVKQSKKNTWIRLKELGIQLVKNSSNPSYAWYYKWYSFKLVWFNKQII